jgi:hypothetical protein
MFSKSVISKLGNIGKYNIKYVDNITIKINNPTTLGFMRSTLYSSDIVFKREGTYIYKTIEKDNIEDLMEGIKETINNEVKL